MLAEGKAGPFGKSLGIGIEGAKEILDLFRDRRDVIGRLTRLGARFNFTLHLIGLKPVDLQADPHPLFRCKHRPIKKVSRDSAARAQLGDGSEKQFGGQVLFGEMRRDDLFALLHWHPRIEKNQHRRTRAAQSATENTLSPPQFL